jgi:hypothetical protein
MLEVRLPEDLPADWLALARERAGMEFTPVLSGDTPFAVDEGTRAQADAQADQMLAAARAINGLGE